MLSKYLTDSRYLVSTLPDTDRHHPCLRNMVDIQHVSIRVRSQSVMWKSIFLAIRWRIDYQGTRLWPKTSFLILPMLQYRRLESFFPGSVTQMLLWVRQWSPTFLIPGTDSWKTIFFHGWRVGNGFRMIPVHYIYCALYYYYYYISSTLNHQALVPRAWGSLTLRKV